MEEIFYAVVVTFFVLVLTYFYFFKSKLDIKITDKDNSSSV